MAGTPDEMVALQDYIKARADFLDMNVREATPDRVFRVCMEFSRKLVAGLECVEGAQLRGIILGQCLAVLRVAKQSNSAHLLWAGTSILKNFVLYTRQNTTHSGEYAKIASVILSLLGCRQSFLPHILEVLHMVLERISTKVLIPNPCDLRVLLPLLASDRRDVLVEAHAVVTYLLAHHVPEVEVLRLCLNVLLTTLSNFLIPSKPLRVACAAVGVQVLLGTREAALEMAKAGFVQKLVDLLEHCRHQEELPIYAKSVLIIVRKLASLGSPFVETMLENNIQSCLGHYAFHFLPFLQKYGSMVAAYLIEFLGAERTLEVLGSSLVPSPYSIFVNCQKDERDAARSLMLTFLQSPQWGRWFFEQHMLPALSAVTLMEPDTQAAFLESLSRSIHQIPIDEQRSTVRGWAQVFFIGREDLLAVDRRGNPRDLRSEPRGTLPHSTV